MSSSSSEQHNTVADFDRIQSAGFVSTKPLEPEDLPTAMEAEVYVDGKLQIKNKKNKNGKKDKETLAEKKKKEMKQTRNFSEICSIFRVLWATRQTEDINKDTDSDRYTKVTLRELVVYAVFLVILCIIAFGMVSSLTYQFSNVLIDSFVTSPTTDTPPLTFATVNQMADIWKVLEGPFLDNLYTDWYQTDDNHTQDLSKYVANENRVLGLSRLRQVRVLNNSCVVPSDFSAEIKYCYSDWAPSVEDQSPFGAYYSQNDTNVSAWYYQSESQLGGSSYQGLMNSYGGGGYILDLSQNKNVSLALIQYLFKNLWIDRGTRAVFFDFTVYNANINLFGQVKLVFELPATGGVTPSYVVRSVKLIRYVSSFDYFILACEIFFCIFIAYYIIEEIIEIHRHRLNYFKTFWNDLDIMIIILAIICIIFNIYRQCKVNDLLESLLANDQQYVDFDFLCYWQCVFNSTVAFMVFLAWIKVFKYVSFNKTMTQLSLTLSRCANDVTGFAIMFFIVFLAYAQLGFLIFGTQMQGYSTFSETIFSLFRLVLGDFDFDAMEQANRVLGPIFFLTYVFFVFFVLLNMFIAIINDTYGEIKMEISSQKSDIELAAFFKKGYNNLMDKLNLKRAHIVDIHQAVTSADLNQDKKIDFIEWRNNLRNKGYGDVEIETLFAKYDADGDRCLNEAEQMAMLKDLADQNKELKQAYKLLSAQEENKKEMDDVKKRKRGEGVTFEDYHLLSHRIDKMEASIGGITNKIDSVLNKLEDIDRAKNDRSNLGSARKSNLGSNTDMRSRNQVHSAENSKNNRNKEPTTFSMMIESKINPVNNSSDC